MGSTSHKTKQTKAAEKGCQYPTRNGDTQTKNSIFKDAEFHSIFFYSGPVNIITFNSMNHLYFREHLQIRTHPN
jgi:hypothetical protein